MEVFVNHITSFPVIVLTFLMAITVCYWLLALLGAVDIEVFDAEIDIDVDADLDFDVDAGGAELETDSGIDAKVSGDAEGLSGVTGFMLKWGLTGVPVTVVLSILIASAWLICYVLVSILSSLVFSWLSMEVLRVLVGLALLLMSLMLSIPLTAQLIRPMKGIFKSHSAADKASFIGSECVVKTGQVTSTFGQATLEDGEAGMLFDVRAEAAYGIKKGDVVILHRYDAEEGSYWVIKATELE